jgi:hypothetical protein
MRKNKLQKIADLNNLLEENPKMTVPTSSASAFRNFLVKFSTEMFIACAVEFDINIYAKRFNLDKRRLYELFSVLCAFTICSRSSVHRYGWNGFSGLVNCIQELILKFNKLNPLVSHSSFVLSISSDTPKIAHMYVVILSTFAGIGVTFKQAAILMATSKTHYKLIIRRLCSIAMYMEHFKIITPMDNKFEYAFTDFIALYPLTSSITMLLSSKLANPEPGKSILYEQLKTFVEMQLSEWENNKNNKNSFGQHKHARLCLINHGSINNTLAVTPSPTATTFTTSTTVVAP